MSHSKIACKNCKRTCCDNMELSLRKGEKGINPKKAKVGDWLFVAGITFVKKVNGLWKCRAFDAKTRLCRIYDYRPPLCREFICKWAKKKGGIIKMPINAMEGYGDNIYTIHFMWNGVNEKPR